MLLIADKDKQDFSIMQEDRQEKSPIKQKILLYLAKKGVSEYEFYKKSGTTRGILAQNNGISEDNIARFLAYAPDVNEEWLLTGRGEMIKTKGSLSGTPADEQPNLTDKDTKNNLHTQGKTTELSTAHPTNNPKEGIPLIPFSAMAGVLTGEQSVLEYECERYVVPAFNGADFLMQVKGNSMMPTYISGDIVACQRVPMSGLFFQWNKPYVLDTAQGAIIKRIKPGSDKQHILIVSDNKEYDPFELPYEDIYAVALVIGIIRLE